MFPTPFLQCTSRGDKGRIRDVFGIYVCQPGTLGMYIHFYLFSLSSGTDFVRLRAQGPWDLDNHSLASQGDSMVGFKVV